MALYHFHVAQVSRGDGQSAVASAAYRAGEKLYDTYYGETHDYTRKGGVILNEIILPDKVLICTLDDVPTVRLNDGVSEQTRGNQADYPQLLMQFI